MNKMSRSLATLSFLLMSPTALAETATTPIPTTSPAKPATSAQAVPVPGAVTSAPAATGAMKPMAVKPAAAPAPVAATKTTPAAPVNPATVSAQTAASQTTATSPVFENILNTTPAISPEQRHQQEMLANAERVDKANRELLARNQELQLQMENLSIQNNVLKRDRSNEGIWNGAGAVIIGFLMGWVFAGIGRRKSSW
jgi:hypothetical protein